MSEISIYGAGLAGMVAGINLAREGFSVIVYDRETSIGGSKNVHPSIHTTPLQPKETWDYIGIDLSESFCPTDTYPDFWYNAKRLTLPPYVNNTFAYNVERGARKTSIDTRLYEIALNEGVKFSFNKNLTPNELKSAPPGSIIATGLYKEAYDLVGVKCNTTYGYMASIPWEQGVSSGAIHMGGYSIDYGYTATLNGLMYVLLFSRTPLKEGQLEQFKKVLKDARGLEFANWHTFNGHFPRETRLFWKDKILTGTLSGMIEPFWGYGIVGALISGKVASLVHTDRKKAEEDFHKFTAGFKRKLTRKEKMDKMPFNKQLLRLGILKARFDCWRNPELKKAVKEPVRWFK
ncbi:MAG: NAD(P)-binding protein [Thermodesulfobacteriota bacterium]|nr:NAD(P)-binding protein [Thermodesulfobacteriota bacterium]